MPEEDEAAQARTGTLAHRAEKLLRALSGVLDARVEARPDGGIGAVHVLAVAGGDRTRTARNVQSALLAGLAAAVDVERIHVIDGAHARRRPAPQASGNGDGPRPAATGARRNGNAPGLGTREADGPEHDDQVDSPRTGPRLVSVEMEERDGGHIACIATVVLEQQVYRATVETPDLPGAAEHAAAEAVTRALRNGGASVALDGVKQTEIAGQSYVVVAARSGDGKDAKRRAAASAIHHSVARAAGHAAILAARQLIG